jgi:hypothetical protein
VPHLAAVMAQHQHTWGIIPQEKPLQFHFSEADLNKTLSWSQRTGEDSCLSAGLDTLSKVFPLLTVALLLEGLNFLAVTQV